MYWPLEHALPSVAGVKMRRRMFIVIHSNHDSEEPANLGHKDILPNVRPLARLDRRCGPPLPPCGSARQQQSAYERGASEARVAHPTANRLDVAGTNHTSPGGGDSMTIRVSVLSCEAA